MPSVFSFNETTGQRDPGEEPSRASSRDRSVVAFLGEDQGWGRLHRVHWNSPSLRRSTKRTLKDISFIDKAAKRLQQLSWPSLQGLGFASVGTG